MKRNSFEIMTVGAFTKSAKVNDILKNIATAMNNSETGTHYIAEQCYNLRECSDFGKGAILEGTKWNDVVYKAFGDSLTANSAYKYAQVYETFCTGDKEGMYLTLWQRFPIGKLIIITSLDSKKHKDAGRSIPGFFSYIGEKHNEVLSQKYADWCNENAALLEKIKKVEDAGLADIAEEYRAKLPESPIEPVADDAPDRDELIKTVGLMLCRNVTDARLKELVANYIDNNATEDEKKKAAEKNEKKAEKNEKKDKEKSLDDLRADAIAAMIAYSSALENTENTGELENATRALELIR